MARDRERKCPPRLGSVRPSLAVNYTAHVADSQRFLLQGPAVLKNKRSRKIAKSGGLRFHSIASRARKRESCCGRGRWRRRWVSDAGAFFPERGFVMPNRIDIDHTHSRAIVKEIGERLRAFLKKSRKCRQALERKSTGSANRKSSHHQSFPVLSAGTNFGVEPCDRRPSNGTLTRGGESFAQPLQGCLAACAKAAVIGTVAGRSCSTNLPAPPLSPRIC